mgnify:CR=1 FL=1
MEEKNWLNFQSLINSINQSVNPASSMMMPFCKKKFKWIDNSLDYDLPGLIISFSLSLFIYFLLLYRLKKKNWRQTISNEPSAKSCHSREKKRWTIIVIQMNKKSLSQSSIFFFASAIFLKDNNNWDLKKRRRRWWWWWWRERVNQKRKKNHIVHIHKSQIGYLFLLLFECIYLKFQSHTHTHTRTGSHFFSFSHFLSVKKRKKEKKITFTHDDRIVDLLLSIYNW